MHAVLKINSQDRPGIVASVSTLIFEAGGNVLDAQQHREELDDQFFTYIKYDIAGLLNPGTGSTSASRCLPKKTVSPGR